MSTPLNSGASARKYLLIACDLDGTLIADHTAVTSDAMHTLERAHKAGMLVVISTGRTYSMIPAKLRNADCIDGFITSNGACGILRGGQTLFTHAFPKEKALQIISDLDREGAAVNAFFNGTALFDRRVLFSVMKSSERLSLHRIGSLFRFLSHSSSVDKIRRRIMKKNVFIEKVGGMFPSEIAAANVLEELSKDDTLNVVTTRGNDIEITTSGVDKGIALQHLCRHFGVNREQTVVCGDSGNDRSMREFCGLFVAPSNASSDVLAIADVVTGDVKKDGIAKWISTELLK